MVRVDQATWKERWILWAHPRGRRRMQLHDDDPRGGKSGCWLVVWKEEPRGRKSHVEGRVVASWSGHVEEKVVLAIYQQTNTNTRGYY